MNQKGFANIILVVVVVVFLGVVGYFVLDSQRPQQEINSPTESPKNKIIGWETYKNERLGYEIMYPGPSIGWEPGPGSNYIKFREDELIFADAHVLVDFKEDFNSIYNQRKEFSASYLPPLTEGTTTIDGVYAKYFYYTSKEGLKNYKYHFEKDNKLFVLQFSSKNEDDVIKYVSSFKFLK